MKTEVHCALLHTCVHMHMSHYIHTCLTIATIHVQIVSIYAHRLVVLRHPQNKLHLVL